MTHFAASKNSIIIGAALSSQDGDIVLLAGFLPSGPTTFADRVTPTIIAPGERILSSRSLYEPLDQPVDPAKDENLCYMSGTSMACALIAGCCVALRGAIINAGWSQPSAALIKCILVCFARSAHSEANPSADGIGWGRADLGAATIILPFAMENFPLRQQALSSSHGFAGFAEGKLKEGEHVVFDYPVPPNRRLVLTVAWTDPPGPYINSQLALQLSVDDQHIRSIGRDNNSNNVLKLNWTSSGVASNASWSVTALEIDCDNQFQPLAICWWWVAKEEYVPSKMANA